MFKNYLVIAIRHLRRHRMFSTINILCLSIGITFTMLIGSYIIDQKNVNGQIRNVENQYFIKSKWKVENMGLAITTAAPLAKSLKEKYPALVANYYRFNPVTNVVSAGDKYLKENIAICDTSLVSMYGFELLHGDKEHAFINNNSAVITEGLAVKLFGSTDVINKTITINNTTSSKQDFSISAVLKSIPYNTVNNAIDPNGYDVFVPFEGNQYFQNGGGENAWENIYMPGLIELKPGISTKSVISAANELLATNLPANLKGFLEPELVSLKKYYLADNNGAVRKMTTVLSLIAIFILLMAVINFVNINIGTSSYRLKEIGLRKVFGGARKQLIIQHLTESMVITMIAGAISVLFFELLRPVFNQVLNTKLERVWNFDLYKTGMFFLLLTIVGIVAGLYPAFVLSSTKIINSVKGKIISTLGATYLRKGLLVVQFSLAIFVFIGALNVSKQVSYFFNKDLGYSKEHLLVITAFPKQWDSAGVQKMETLQNGLKELAIVKNATISFEVPDRTPPSTIDILPQGSNQPAVIPYSTADKEYASTFDLKNVEGDFFTDLRNSSDNEIVLNETAAKLLGLTSPVGKIVRTPAGSDFKIAGVIKDFNYSSFQQSIGPVAFLPVNIFTQYRYLTVKMQTNNIAKGIEQIRDKWRSISPESPFEYTFMDQRFASLYNSELQLKSATNVATILNFLIVLMGIFGVVAFTLAKRNKEIAVRKVLGADVKNILGLFIRDYAWLILIANLIAWPLAYLVINKWLEGYSYRIEQSFGSYLLVGGIVYLIAIVLISIQCMRSAISNPVCSLRTE